MKKRARFLCSAAVLLSLTFGSNGIRADVEEATAPTKPWSGYWWPIKTGEHINALKKYDKLTGSDAADWEKTTNPPGKDVPQWYGYCQGWSASSIMEKEPTEPIKVKHTKFSVGDQKALLALSHAFDVSNPYGKRFKGEAEDDKADIAPDELWIVLRRHLKEQGLPLVFDLDAGTMVWNYPVYAYRVTFTPVDGEVCPCTLGIWFADDNVQKEFVGTKRGYQEYTFEAKFQNGKVVLGTGKWTGASVEKHPDFAWSPYIVRPENPNLDYQRVCEILGRAPAEDIDVAKITIDFTQERTETVVAVTDEPDSGNDVTVVTAVEATEETTVETTEETTVAATEITAVETTEETTVAATVVTNTDNAEPDSDQVQAAQNQTAQDQPAQDQVVQNQPDQNQTVPTQQQVVPPKTEPEKPETTVVTTPPPAQKPVQPTKPGTVTVATVTADELAALVEGKASDWGFDISVDKFDGSDYQVGEGIAVDGKSDEAGYLYLIAIDPDGNRTLLYPTDNADNRIEANEQFYVPSAESNRKFHLTGPFGDYHILGIVSEEKLNVTASSAQQSDKGGKKISPAIGRFAQDSVVFAINPVSETNNNQQKQK